MRNNQVSLKISRYNDQVPDTYNSDRQIISVHSDSNNLFEALTLAYIEAVKELQKYEEFPSFGRIDVSNNLNNPRLRLF